MPFTSTTRDVPAARRSGLWRRLALLTLAALWAFVAWWQTNKSLPPGLQTDSGWLPVNAHNVAFIADVTAADAYGRAVSSQAIFDDVLAAVRGARRFIVLDYHLFNSVRDPGTGTVAMRPLSTELRDALLEQRRSQPDVRVLLIIDPVNLGYDAALPRDLQLLQAAGVAVVPVRLDRLRDPNYIYSSLWRLAFAWWTGPQTLPPTAAADSWPDPLDESVRTGSFGAWLRLLNFKADRRKVLLADDGHDSLLAIVGSANPHDASSSHSNTALKFQGAAALPLLQSELAIARFSGWNGQLGLPSGWQPAPAGGLTPTGDARLKVLTEGAIRTELLRQLQAAATGDNIDIAMLYIADRGVMEALLAAARRQVNVRLILDPNREAFGHAKAGIPNQPAASELVAASDGAIHVRWYRTHGEQFHSSLVMIYGTQRLWVTTGSATLTRRSLGDYDLEANVALDLDVHAPLARQMLDYIDTLWSNRAGLGIEYTTDFGFFADPSQLNYWLYRLLEGTGASAF
jgi:phosphatidylserine/phosphatidylglycerophosphate/cardiolipin synthase-like enzyme